MAADALPPPMGGPGDPTGKSSGHALSPSRRAVLLGVPGALVLTGLATTKAAAAANVVVPTGDDYVDQGFNALAAYVLPGNDPYSVQQANTSPTPGGVAGGTADMLKATYDGAFNISVAPTLGVNLPGAGGIAVVLDIATRGKYLLQSFGPFQHPFANLTFAQKAQVLAALDESTTLRSSPIGFAFGTFITLATLGAFTETAVFDTSTRQLTGIPIGWQRTKFGGVSNGWPEYKGYWQGRTSVSDPGKAV